MANSNLAYDLSIYAPKAEEKASWNQELRVVRNKSRGLAAAFTPRTAALFMLVLSVLGLIVYNQVCLNEVTGEISRLESELAIMESESTRFASLLESTVSLRAVAQQAEEELGMTKLDQFRTRYVYLYEQDQIVVGAQDEEPSEETGFLESIIDKLKEYPGE
ncbi:MAG: hypothetical protein LBU86_05190 [Oscillospiraceae bacterium]|nr:hypothetical protein [Oscillospiraceae bacterium]